MCLQIHLQAYIISIFLLCFIFIAESYTLDDVKKLLRTIVETWNNIGVDPKFFNYTSSMKERDIFRDNDELGTFDPVSPNTTVVDMMKALYDMTTNDALLELIKVEDILGEFFQDQEQSKEAIKAYLTKENNKRNLFCFLKF